MAPVHPSLIRPITFLGLERPLGALYGTLLLVLTVGVRFNRWGLLCAALLGLLLPLLRKVTESDPQGFACYVRSLRYQPFYPARALWTAPPSTHPEPLPDLPG